MQCVGGVCANGEDQILCVCVCDSESEKRIPPERGKMKQEKVTNYHYCTQAFGRRRWWPTAGQAKFHLDWWKLLQQKLE